MKQNETPWPRNPDGSSKMFSELTQEERKAQLLIACAEIQQELRSPQFKKVMQEETK